MQPRTAIRLRALGVLADTFRIFGRAPIFFLTLSAIKLVPLKYAFRHLGWSDQAHWYSPLEPAAINQVILGLVQAALIDRALRLIDERKAPLRETIGPGFRRALPVLLVSLIQLLAGLSGYLLLVVPGFFVSAALLVAGPICLEGQSPFRSIAQSWRTTRGARWPLAGALFVLWSPLWTLVVVLRGYSEITGHEVPYDIYPIAISTMVVSALATVLSVAAYGALRPDAERAQLAEVFA